MNEYNDLSHIIVSIAINSIQSMVVLFVYGRMFLPISFKYRYLFYAVCFGFITVFLEWICTLLFSPINGAVSTFLTATLYFLVYKYVFDISIKRSIISLLAVMVLNILSSLEAAMLLSFFKVEQVFSDIKTYFFASLLTYTIFILQLLVVRIFRIFLGLPERIRSKVIFSNLAFLVIAICIITANMNYYVNWYKTENKWIIITNSALLVYLIYTTISMNINMLRYRDLMAEHVSTMEELAVTKERNRFTKDMHDTTGHTLSKIIALLEICRSSTGDVQKTEKLLEDALGNARQGLKEVRRAIDGYDPEMIENCGLEKALQTLFVDFENSGIKIDFTFEDETEYYKDAKIANAIYRITQEALTNAVRHGHAKNITMILRLGKMIKIFICDDGVGCENLKKGFGLLGMEQRVKELNGRIHYGSNDGKGFNICIEIPSEKK